MARRRAHHLARPRPLRTATAVLASAAMLAIVGVSAPTAGAGAPPVTVIVTTTADVVDGGDGETSLREAFEAANANGEATVVKLVRDEVHTLTDCAASANGDLIESATEAFTLDGRGATIHQTCGGGGVLTSYGGDVTVKDVTITGGNRVGGCCGGALFADAGTGRTVISDVRMLFNTNADGSGGGGLMTYGDTVRIERSLFMGNTATGSGGGGVRSESPTTVVDSAFIGNETTSGVGGGLWVNADVVLKNVTFSGNEASGAGGALTAISDAELKHVTVAGNTSDGGQVAVAGELRLGGTVLADPLGTPENCAATSFVSLGQNHATDATCGLDGPGDVAEGADPGLRAPFRNGGGTYTLYPRASSPLLDAVPAADPHLPETDQRQLKRPGGTAGDVGALEVQPCGGRFTDLATGQAFCWEIGWLADAGITTGNVDGSFGVTGPVTRGAMAAFLYRLAGSPSFTPPGTATFADVPVGSLFATPVEWLAATGITTGSGDGTFGVGQVVTRASMSAFLYRLAGQPAIAVPGSATYPDVPTGSLFFATVEWLSTTGITGGFGDGTFGPALPVSRQSMAAFLYRFVDGQHVLPT